jgi:hypothetical protein
MDSIVKYRGAIREGFVLSGDVSVADARRVWADVRVSVGLMGTTPGLLGDGQISKTNKNKVRTFTLSLAQSTMSGVVNTCPWSVPDCVATCVAQNGNGAYDGVKLGRTARTVLLVARPDVFFALLRNELRTIAYKAAAEGVPVAVRMNTYSDVPWSTWVPELFGEFPAVMFYDYTKNMRAVPLSNYHLTYSVTGRMSADRLDTLLGHGRNVAMVTTARKGDPVPTTYRGHPVVDGDATDYRPDDGAGVVVHLYAKGRARRLAPGPFVRTLDGFDYNNGGSDNG